MTRNEMFNKLTSRVADINENSKILLLTHTDLDGSGPVMALQGFNNVDIKHVANFNMSSTIKTNALEHSNEYDLIIATDISCNLEDAESIKDVPNIILLDHHKTALALNDYPFAVVAEFNPEDTFCKEKYPDNYLGRASGTSLLVDFMYESGMRKENATLNEIAHAIRAYDTWDWYNTLNDTFPQVFNNAAYAVGLNRFEQSKINLIAENPDKVPENLLSELEETVLEIEKEKQEAYINSIRNKYIENDITVQGKDYSMLFCSATQFNAAVFDDMREQYPEKDIFVIYNGVSFGMRAQKDDIDITPIATLCGGGGHAHAAGFSCDTGLDLFKNTIKNAEEKARLEKIANQEYPSEEEIRATLGRIHQIAKDKNLSNFSR